VSPHTINTRLSGIKTLVRVSAACGQLDRTVSYDFALVEKVKLSALRARLKTRTHRRYTPAEIRALCNAPDAATLTGLRDRALLATLASSGCRITEVLGLTRDHIVPFGDGWGLQVPGKGQSQERLTPLSQEAYRWMQRWLTAPPPSSATPPGAGSGRTPKASACTPSRPTTSAASSAPKRLRNTAYAPPSSSWAIRCSAPGSLLCARYPQTTAH
jgi:integrase